MEREHLGNSQIDFEQKELSVFILKSEKQSTSMLIHLGICAIRRYLQLHVNDWKQLFH